MVSTGPWCSKSLNITVTLTVDEGYEYNSSNPGYQFTLAIYNKCGDGDSITYEEAIKHLDGEYFILVTFSFSTQTTMTTLA